MYDKRLKVERGGVPQTVCQRLFSSSGSRSSVSSRISSVGPSGQCPATCLTSFSLDPTPSGQRGDNLMKIARVQQFQRLPGCNDFKDCQDATISNTRNKFKVFLLFAIIDNVSFTIIIPIFNLHEILYKRVYNHSVNDRLHPISPSERPGNWA